MKSKDGKKRKRKKRIFSSYSPDTKPLVHQIFFVLLFPFYNKLMFESQLLNST